MLIIKEKNNTNIFLHNKRHRLNICEIMFSDLDFFIDENGYFLNLSRSYLIAETTMKQALNELSKLDELLRGLHD